jgi:hypothetical protein
MSAPGMGVAVRGASPADVDVRLDRKTLPWTESQRECFPTATTVHRGLVTESRRLFREVAAVKLRIDRRPAG